MFFEEWRHWHSTAGKRSFFMIYKTRLSLRHPHLMGRLFLAGGRELDRAFGPFPGLGCAAGSATGALTGTLGSKSERTFGPTLCGIRRSAFGGILRHILGYILGGTAGL